MPPRPLSSGIREGKGREGKERQGREVKGSEGKGREGRKEGKGRKIRRVF